MTMHDELDHPDTYPSDEKLEEHQSDLVEKCYAEHGFNPYDIDSEIVQLPDFLEYGTEDWEDQDLEDLLLYYKENGYSAAELKKIQES